MFSVSHKILSKLVNVLLPHCSFIPFTSIYSVFSITPVLWNSLPSDLRHVAHLVTPSHVVTTPVSDLPTSLFLKKVKNLSLSLFLSSLVCIHLGYLRTDISGIDQASLLHLIHIPLSFSPSFYSCHFIFYFTCKCL